MKLFWREQTPLILLYAAQLLLTGYLCRLSGVRNPFDLAYIALVSTALFALYLIFRYVRHIRFYRRLAARSASLAESAEFVGNAPLAEALGHLLQRNYRLYQEELGQSRRKLGDQITFIHQWVHQMKTPLSVMHLALRQEPDPFFDGLREEIDKLKKGLDTVLYTSRLEAFEQDFAVEPVLLGRLVGTVTAEHKNLCIRHRVFPDIRVDDRLTILTDEKWLAFAIGQLLTNAVRYSAGTSSRMEIAADMQGREACLEIRDSGVGIPGGDLGRVFDPYFTGENGRRFGESTGMGLYLVREIAARLGHRIEIESRQGQGTTVRLWMNLAGEAR
ncbi:sensor histidine kinase [Saccharibacillus deserti]|uniref:sensor histidine kinase n=1 Tax=Saccharibacillus deserti TaxID=1634444 RepID=UPI001557ABA0|nr:sensor histidine kinase [Saccharibacillus deserti]